MNGEGVRVCECEGVGCVNSENVRVCVAECVHNIV